ncbi:FAD-dependent monooxygenase [Streptomyces sp. NBC_01433]|uniref:FAD-dependent monooxygenase n=1 Tax=Streptomyces sp. NBC_01433 TaxID=2903864 RepID=UPI002256A41A|nr:FAD-dependent monooxygenase [Streptomyces sp. NBC_01433]
MRLPHENVDQLNTLDTAWNLLEPWGRTPANTTIERHTVYTFRARWLDSWRHGRVLLAGDAAHQMPPFAAQGMCSGLLDALNLSGKLDLVLCGICDDAPLDSYTTERSGHVLHPIGMSTALGQVICILDEQRAAQRDAHGCSRATRRPSQGPSPTPPPVLGDGILRNGPDGLTAPGHETL